MTTLARIPGTGERIRALLGSTTLYRLGAALAVDQPVGRPAVHPPYVLLAYGVLARLLRSGTRVGTDLGEPGIWPLLRQQMIDAAARRRLDLPEPGLPPPRWDHWRWFRDRYLVTDEGLRRLASTYPAVAVDLAHRIGLIDPTGPGSLTHPHPARTIYGDGTTVRPLYIPPAPVTVPTADGTDRQAFLDPATGVLHPEPVHRYDHDLRPYFGSAPWQLSHGYVAYHARGPAPYQRVVLAVAHIPHPGAEASTAVQLLGDVHRAARTGVQVVVYDGAFTGVHADQIMTRYGYLVLSKMPTSSDELAGAQLVRSSDGRRLRSYPLGVVSHTTPAGPCEHALAAVAGRVMVIELDETGDPVATHPAVRGAVKRSRRADGRWHFNVGYTVACPLEPFTVWLSPHAGRDGDYRRPHNLRVIPEDDPDFLRLRGLRSDAENYHTNYKRTLMLGRAMSLGWRRVLIDNYCFCILNNALTEHRGLSANQVTTAARRLRPTP